MPEYQYVCKGCDKIFSARRSVSERNDILSCPKCGSGMERHHDFGAVNVMSNVVSVKTDEYFTDYGSTQERLSDGIRKQKEDFVEAKVEISRERDRLEDKLGE